ncbi:MAG: hypothetical protein GEV28_19350 [Actinophytocola sp.]|uniref:hypothetical protein n=1 Tax=Actinophytocola sp. TaxID=1872138 RepID=UPI00132911F9|nr:hypothetical protein [Actinophytocola sp.]MPZ82434.1 hypothetical protein [Actinophytocola sp.]
MSVDQAVPRHLSPPPSPRSPGRHIALAAFAVAAVPFAVHAVVWFGGYFGQDDFVITYRAAHASPLDLGFLFQEYNGHLQPGAFLLAWVVTQAAPLSFTVAVMPLLVMQAAILWLYWRVLTRLFGPRWALVPLYAVFACSPLILYPTLWWAYALQLLPFLLAVLAALHAHLRYLDGRGGWWGSMLWMVFGLAFYEKAALVPVALLGVTALLAPRTEAGPILWALRRYRRLWFGFAGLLAAFGMAFLVLTDSQTRTDTVTSRSMLEFAYKSIVDNLLPGLVGGPLTTAGGGSAIATPSLALRLGSAAVVVAVIVVSVTRSRRRALLPWLFLAAYLTVTLGLVATTRLGKIGLGVGADPRYVADAVPVAVLCAAFALLPARRLTEPAEPAPAPPAPRWRLVATVLTVLLVTNAMATFVRIAPALQFREARDYVAAARDALAANPEMVLLDGPTPDSVIISWFLADASASRAIGLLPENPRFDRPTEKLYRLDSTGRPQPVLTLTDPVAAMPGPAPDCGYLVEDETVRIPMEDTVSGRRIVRIGYYTADPGIGIVRLGDTSTEVEFDAGLHVVHLVVTGSFTHVDVTRDLDVTPICVTDIQAGTP